MKIINSYLNMGNNSIKSLQIKDRGVLLGNKTLRWGNEELGHLYDSSGKLYIKLNESLNTYAHYKNEWNRKYRVCGTIYYENGDIYVGTLNYWFYPSGKGEMTFSNGNKYVGTFDCQYGNWKYYDGEYGMGSFNGGNIEFLTWQDIRAYNGHNYPTGLSISPIQNYNLIGANGPVFVDPYEYTY